MMQPKNSCEPAAEKALARANPRQPLYLALGLALFVIAYFLPLPPPVTVGSEEIILTLNGKLCLGLLAVAILFWVTEVLPFHVTALGAMLLMPLLGVTDGVEVLKQGGEVVRISGVAQGYKEIVRISFGNDLVLFFLGVFLLSGAFTFTTLESA